MQNQPSGNLKYLQFDLLEADLKSQVEEEQIVHSFALRAPEEYRCRMYSPLYYLAICFFYLFYTDKIQ